MGRILVFLTIGLILVIDSKDGKLKDQYFQIVCVEITENYGR
jgi:hypothetical protein